MYSGLLSSASKTHRAAVCCAVHCRTRISVRGQRRCHALHIMEYRRRNSAGGSDAERVHAPSCRCRSGGGPGGPAHPVCMRSLLWPPTGGTCRCTARPPCPRQYPAHHSVPQCDFTQKSWNLSHSLKIRLYSPAHSSPTTTTSPEQSNTARQVPPKV